MQYNQGSSGSKDSASPTETTSASTDRDPLMALIRMDRSQERKQTSDSAGCSPLASERETTDLDSSNASVSPILTWNGTPRTSRTPQSQRSSKSSCIPVTGIFSKRSSKKRSDEGTDESKESFTRRVSNRSSIERSNSLMISDTGSRLYSSEQSMRLTRSERKRPASNPPLSKRRRPNSQDARVELHSSFYGTRANQFNKRMRKKFLSASSHQHQTPSRFDLQTNNGLRALRLNFSVQGRDIWGNGQIEDYVLELDVDHVKECFDFYNRKLKGSYLESADSMHNDQEFNMRKYLDPPESYLRPAFAALCGVTSKLRDRNEQLASEREMLQDKIDYLEAGPKTPDSLAKDDDNHMVQRLLHTIRDLEAEIALLKLTQHDALRFPQEGGDYSHRVNFRPDSYLELLPAPVPIHTNVKRTSIALNECREEERARYEQRLDRIRQGILKRQQKLDTLTSEHEQDLSELRQQLNWQQEERNNMLERIRYLQESNDDYDRTLEDAARQYRNLQQKHDALDLEYIKVKKQRDGAVNVGRRVNNALNGLLLRQIQSQVTTQQIFEQTKVRISESSAITHQGVVPTSPGSEDTMANLRRRGHEQRTSSLTSQSVATNTAGRRPRPAPIQLGRRSKQLPEIDRSKGTTSDQSRAMAMLDPGVVIENLPPGSPGENSWREAMKTPQGLGCPGLTPLFQTEAFRQWKFQFGQLARVIVDINSMDANRQLHSFSQNEVVYAFPGAGDFWPVQTRDSDLDSDQVFAIPRSVIELICEHERPYHEAYYVVEGWKPRSSDNDMFIPLSTNKFEDRVVQCAHYDWLEQGGRIDQYGCLLLSNGNRGYAPKSCLEVYHESEMALTEVQCPCADSRPYTRLGSILKGLISEPNGVIFHENDTVQIAHPMPTGEFCVRSRKNGATGFVHAANLRIFEVLSEIIVDSRVERRHSQMSLQSSVEAAFPSPKTKEEIWNNNLTGRNPQYHRRSQLDVARDRIYQDWALGPPLGNHFIETADFRKLPQVWQNILTFNPPNVTKGPNRARAKSMISRKMANKYRIKRGLHIGPELVVTIADGEIAYILPDGTEEDRGYMSEPVSAEKRSRRAQVLFEPGKSPLDVSKYKVTEEREVMKILKKAEPGILTNKNHRRSGYLTKVGLRALENYTNGVTRREIDDAALRKLVQWMKIGNAVAYELQPRSGIRGKVNFEDTDLFTIHELVPREGLDQSAVLAIHLDRFGGRKDSSEMFIRADELLYDDPKVPTCSISIDLIGGRQKIAKVILLGTVKEGRAWRCVRMGDGTLELPDEMRIISLQEETPFKYVPLSDVLRIIEDAEKRARGEVPNLRSPEMNDTVRRLYKPYYQLDELKDEPIPINRYQQLEDNKTHSESDSDQPSTGITGAEHENTELSIQDSALQQDKESLELRVKELERAQMLSEKSNASLELANKNLEEKVKELEAEIRARPVEDEIPWEYRRIGKETKEEARHTSPQDTRDFRFHESLGEPHGPRFSDMKQIHILREFKTKPVVPISTVTEVDEEDDGIVEIVRQIEQEPPYWLQVAEAPPLWVAFRDIWIMRIVIYIVQIQFITYIHCTMVRPSKTGLSLTDIAEITFHGQVVARQVVPNLKAMEAPQEGGRISSNAGSNRMEALDSPSASSNTELEQFTDSERESVFSNRKVEPSEAPDDPSVSAYMARTMSQEHGMPEFRALRKVTSSVEQVYTDWVKPVVPDGPSLLGVAWWFIAQR